MGKGLGRRRLLIAALIAALVVVPAALVLSQQGASSATTVLTIFDGTVSVGRGASPFAPAADGDILGVGDRVQTAERSHALITFFDGSTVQIEPDTTVQIEEAHASTSGAIGIRIAQTLGRTWASVQKLAHAESRFEVRTPTLTAAVRGTGFITEVLADGTSSVQTIDGSVQVTAQGQSVTLSSGQTSSAAPGSPPTPPAPSAAPANRLRFGLHSPAYLVALDPLGRACGIVLPGPTVVRQIPGCTASEPGTQPQLVDVPNAVSGVYRVAIAMIAPGGAFTVTAAAVDRSGALSFDHSVSGSGEPGAKLATSLDVAVAANGALSSSGLGPLTVIEGSPVKVARGSPSARPTVSGTPDPSVFAALPTATATAAATSPSPTSSATPASSPAATATAPATSQPTAVTTQAPTARPTTEPTPPPTAQPTPQPTPVPTPQPTPTPTPQPTPTPAPPTLSGGSASAGGTLPVLGLNWSAGTAVTIRWPDGTQVGSADVQADGRFATQIRVPQNATAGATYKITASGGGLTATADVLVTYSPTLSLLVSFPPRAGTAVQYSGSGWPPNTSYTVRLGTIPVGSGTTTAAGTLPANSSFVVPQNTPPGSHTVTATAGNYSATAQLTTQ